MDAYNNMILDLGSDTIKGGTTADALPSLVFPSVVGKPQRRRNVLMRRTAPAADAEEAANTAAFLVGYEALQNAQNSSLCRPIRHGVIEDWAMFEHLANHSYSDLGLEHEDTVVTLTQPLYQPHKCTDSLAQTFFETFGAPGVALVWSGSCSLYASGRTTGLVLESGEGVTQITPVVEGYQVVQALARINSAGGSVTEHLKRIAVERGYVFTGTDDSQTLQKVKESLCFVASDYAAYMTMADDDPSLLASYELPDGQNVEIGKERFRAPEILFNPLIIQSELPSLQEMVRRAVQASAIDMRRSLLANIVVAGGNTMFHGFGGRLKDEVAKDFPALFGSINVIEAEDRHYSTFSGASVVASLPVFNSQIVTREMYDDEGPQCLRNNVVSTGEGEDVGPPEDE